MANIEIVGLQANGGVGQIVVTWAADDPNAAGLPALRFDHANVYYSSSSSMANEVKASGNHYTAFVLSSLDYGTTRYFQVAAVDRAGNEGPRSSIVQATTYQDLSISTLTAAIRVTTPSVPSTLISDPTFSSLKMDKIKVISAIDRGSPLYAFSALLSGDYERGLFVQTSGDTADGIYGYVGAQDSIGVFGQNTSLANDSRGAGVAGSAGGCVGVRGYSSTSFAFYSSNGGYGPFTGAHDALISRLVEPIAGDVVSDVRIVSRRGISDAISEVSLASRPRQHALGIFVRRRPLSTKDTFAAMKKVGQELVDKFDCAIINAVGEGAINVCSINGNIKAGDLLVASALPGKAMRQNDDLVRSYTVARAREDAIFDEHGLSQIACIYLCG